MKAAYFVRFSDKEFYMSIIIYVYDTGKEPQDRNLALIDVTLMALKSCWVSSKAMHMLPRRLCFTAISPYISLFLRHFTFPSDGLQGSAQISQSSN